MKPNRTTGTEQAILEAAETLFLQKGFALTSTVEIARLAGCNQPTVHYYFRSKDRLFQAVFEKKAGLFFSAFQAIGKLDVPFVEKVRHYVETHFDIVRANPQLPFLIVSEMLTNPERMEGMKQRVGPVVAPLFAALDEELQAEVAAGRVRPIKLLDLLFSVVSLNAAVFLGMPVLRKTVLASEEAYEAFVNRRRTENVRLILSSLEP